MHDSRRYPEINENEMQKQTQETHHHHHEERLTGTDTFEKKNLLTVGIDVGSSGTQVLFSRLTMRRLGYALSSRYAVVSRKTIFASEVSFTPYIGRHLIDGKGVYRIVERAYGLAGIRRSEVDTGALILTGEAVRRRNSRVIADSLSAELGKFVCVTAGNRLEAMLAAHGSGAVTLSRQYGKQVMNVDIGGGTTKVAIAKRGRVVATSALHVGGRLIVTDKDRRVVRVEPIATRICEHLGLDVKAGEVFSDKERQIVCDWMAFAIKNFITGRNLGSDWDWLLLSRPIVPSGIDAIVFSGGVSEYVYGKEKRDFHDLGKPLGERLGMMIQRKEFGAPVVRGKQRIRATVTGVSQFTIQLSGETVYVSDEGILPIKNARVAELELKVTDQMSAQEVVRSVRRANRALNEVNGGDPVVYYIKWEGEPSYQKLRSVAVGLSTAMKDTGTPLILISDQDVSQNIGAILKEELGVVSPVVTLDGLELQDFDYVDIGHPLTDSSTLPVTVKSLIFGTGHDKTGDPAG
ncbi:MAG: ethanolamine ammonia-lyase reactivating factor EutA [Nitrososphaerota archaeon]|nr:ethanolamine ammonia-lyase reactivating factor EutA [Nitrososphaerota archaeon]